MSLDMETTLRGVNVMPASGEFVYNTTEHLRSDGNDGWITENEHTTTGNTDFVASMDILETAAPNVDSASLVVSWFGSSLDATVCEVRPKVDNDTKVTTPYSWTVAGETRSTAAIVTQINSSPAFGGTPSDHSVREAVIEMKARGLRVMFYPFLMMDMAGYPWRGRIEGNPTNFLGSAAVSEFTRNAQGVVSFSGTAEWTQRRMMLHYATLLGDLLTAGDAFLVGSELRGLSENQSSWGTGLATLMTDVRTKLASGVKVSYAADWSEYKMPNLSATWTSADFIGIDWYMPLTDWRSVSDAVYDRATFKAGMESGEYWDYYYADQAGRDAGTQLPITDNQWRQKNIDYWRNTNHSGKEIWLTEFGCPAVDKGGNQPNVFVDPKSSESSLPYYSDGTRNDTVQRLFIEAMLEYFGENPAIVNPANMFVWAWDARPYPEFPDGAIWGDSSAWETGHWIGGRIGAIDDGGYGYQAFDDNGDEIIDTTTAVQTLIKYDTIYVSLYRDPDYGATYFDYSLPGVTSQQDLEDNYIIQHVDSGSWNLIIAGTYGQTFPITYVSPGVIRFSGGGPCFSFLGDPVACDILDVDHQYFDIYIRGKTL